MPGCCWTIWYLSAVREVCCPENEFQKVSPVLGLLSSTEPGCQPIARAPPAPQVGGLCQMGKSSAATLPLILHVWKALDKMTCFLWSPT